MSVEIVASPAFRAGVPNALFRIPSPLSGFPSLLVPWDVASDGKRFLIRAPAAHAAAPFTVVLNWQAALKK